MALSERKFLYTLKRFLSTSPSTIISFCLTPNQVHSDLEKKWQKLKESGLLKELEEAEEEEEEEEKEEKNQQEVPGASLPGLSDPEAGNSTTGKLQDIWLLVFNWLNTTTAS